MRMINLSMNAINETEGEYIERYLSMTLEELQIILIHNAFEGKYKEKLKKKYRKNL